MGWGCCWCKVHVHSVSVFLLFHVSFCLAISAMAFPPSHPEANLPVNVVFCLVTIYVTRGTLHSVQM